MVKLNKFTVSILLASTMFGCKGECKPKVLIAKKDIDVYETHKHDSLKKIFSIHAGDQCAAGEQKIEKMFGYIEVLCPDKGYGWVILGEDYVIIDQNTVKK